VRIISPLNASGFSLSNPCRSVLHVSHPVLSPPVLQNSEIEAPVSKKVERITNAPTLISATSQDDNKLAAACGTVDVDDDEMEQEEMFVDPHKSLGHDKREWGGPRRGGRLLEPTRFGDWERKGRCSDF